MVSSFSLASLAESGLHLSKRLEGFCVHDIINLSTKLIDLLCDHLFNDPDPDIL